MTEPQAREVMCGVLAKCGRQSPSAVRIVLLLCGGTKKMSELARDLGLSTAAITGLVDALEHSGMVVRSAHPSDRRVLLVSLTRCGEEFAAEITRPFVAAPLHETFSV